MIPSAKPKLSRSAALALVKKHYPAFKGGVVVLGVRGYYQDTMGKVGANDRGIYDDALIVISDNVYATFNGNTDPRQYKSGIATLTTGVWWYKKGKHKILMPPPIGYMAFVQADKVTVSRDKKGLDTGWFGINIHRGSVNSTSSAGCQTIPPSQWEGFKNLVYTELDRAKQKTFPYVLINGPVL